ncbi:MAG: RNA polymerase sigma factor [Lachnospiraceae bacterium]|nr:RNA polymerase sigma factor [Lachnospiraceae bacterium]
MHIFFHKKADQNKAFIEQIILEQYNRYYRMAYSYVHNDADACDIVQNGAYRALRASATLKKTEYAETWVYRIMLNECFRVLEQPRHFSYEYLQEEKGFEPASTKEDDISIDLQRALDALPGKDRAVVILRYFEDRKLDEIAQILGENLSTVKSRLYRSMGKLRSVLGDEYRE